MNVFGLWQQTGARLVRLEKEHLGLRQHRALTHKQSCISSLKDSRAVMNWCYCMSCLDEQHQSQVYHLHAPLPQGVIPTAQRAAIVVGVELPVYDITKKHLLRSGVMGDTILTHFM